MMGLRLFRRELFVYRWPIPVAALGIALATTNPAPYLLTSTGATQRALYLLMGVTALLASVFPRRILVRDCFAGAAVLACGFRAATLVFHPGIYGTHEVFAYATTWIVVALLVVSMTVVTWPAIALRAERRE